MAKKVHYIEIEEENEKEYWIAAHTSYEGFQLAYFINKNCSLNLRRSDSDIRNYMDKGVFNIFEFNDEINGNLPSVFSGRIAYNDLNNLNDSFLLPK